MREKAWNKFLTDTVFGEVDIVSARNGNPGKQKIRLITKWSDDPNKGVHLSIKDVADYLDEQGVLVEMLHPSDKYQGKKWEEVLKSYNHKELTDLHRKIFDLQYISGGGEGMKGNVKKYNKKRYTKKRKKKKTMKGGYPFWHDDVPKGITREQYKRLEKTKPKNKSMKVWIRENKKNMKKYTKKRTRKNNIQKGGFCPPCLIAPIAAAAGLSTAGYMVSKSSSSSNVNGKRILKRKESYSMKRNGKQLKKVYEQKNNLIYLNGKEIKPRSKDINDATKRLNKKIKECLKSGFNKC
mgnify:CR=1 FL=1|jgi:hypothetical protein